MTKITVLNPPKEEQKELKKIEFIAWIREDGKAIGKPHLEPSDYDSINVLLRSHNNEFDILECKKESYTNFYTGHYNDGVV